MVAGSNSVDPSLKNQERGIFFSTTLILTKSMKKKIDLLFYFQLLKSKKTMISGSICISLNPKNTFREELIDKLKDILQKWFEEDGEDVDFRFDKNEFLLEAGFALFGHGDILGLARNTMKKEDNPERKLEDNLSEILINSKILDIHTKLRVIDIWIK